MNGFVQASSFTGVPQGCVLSPLCFNAYIDGIFYNLPSNVHVLGYADDIVLFCSSVSVDDATDSLQTALNTINSKLLNLHLSLSVNKTKAMVFSKHQLQYRSYTQNLQIENENIQYVSSFNFLGFTFQNNLKLKLHVEHVIKKCFGFINILRSLCGVSWGSDTKSLILLYF